MNELIEMNKTMTVYEIAKLVNYESTHANAMQVCETLIRDPEFKPMETIVSLESVTYGDNGQTTQSYALNKRQSFALASRLNVSFLMKVIDRWQELENPTPLTGIELARIQLQLQIDLEASKQEVLELSVTLDEAHEWSSIKRQEKLHFQKFDWRQLTNWGNLNGYERKDVFDQNYGIVKSYHKDVWANVYGIRKL